MRLAHDRVGAGPPLVLLHPLGADRHVWRPVLEHLAGHREVLAVDLPGFGGSPPLCGDASPAALGRAVAAFLAGLGLDGGRAHLAGNSLGGWVALEAALLGAGASVTAIAPAGLWSRPLPPKPEVARTLARAGRPVLRALARSGPGRRLVLLGVVAHPERVGAQDAAALVRAYADAPGFTAVNRAMRAGTFRALGEVDAPVTLVWPEHDRLVARPAAAPPGVRQLALPGCGHLPMWDDPAAVAQALLVGSGDAVVEEPAA